MSGNSSTFVNNLENFPSLESANPTTTPSTRSEKRKQPSPDSLSTPDSVSSSGGRPTTKRGKQFGASHTYTLEHIGSKDWEDISDESLEFLPDEISTMIPLQEFAKLTTKEKDKEYEKLCSLMSQKSEELKEAKKEKADALKSVLNMTAASSKDSESINLLSKTNASLEEEIKSLKSVSDKSNSNNPNTSEGLFDQVVAYTAHLKEKEQKKNNIVIYGVPEVNEDENAQGKDDEDFVKEALSVVGCEDASKIDQVFRIGKKTNYDGSLRKFPRVLKVWLTDEAIKNTLLRKQQKVKENVETFRDQDYSQYMREDMTSWELEKHRDLAKKRNERNANLKEGEGKWKVFGNKLVQGNVKTQ